MHYKLLFLLSAFPLICGPSDLLEKVNISVCCWLTSNYQKSVFYVHSIKHAIVLLIQFGMGYLVKGRNIPPFCRESVSAKVRFSPTQHLWSDLCSRIEWWGRIQGRETTTSFMLCWPGLAKAKRVNKDTMHINTHAFTHIHKSRCVIFNQNALND